MVLISRKSLYNTSRGTESHSLLQTERLSPCVGRHLGYPSLIHATVTLFFHPEKVDEHFDSTKVPPGLHFAKASQTADQPASSLPGKLSFLIKADVKAGRAACTLPRQML